MAAGSRCRPTRSLFFLSFLSVILSVICASIIYLALRYRLPIDSIRWRLCFAQRKRNVSRGSDELRIGGIRGRRIFSYLSLFPLLAWFKFEFDKVSSFHYSVSADEILSGSEGEIRFARKNRKEVRAKETRRRKVAVARRPDPRMIHYARIYHFSRKKAAIYFRMLRKRVKSRGSPVCATSFTRGARNLPLLLARPFKAPRSCFIARGPFDATNKYFLATIALIRFADWTCGDPFIKSGRSRFDAACRAKWVARGFAIRARVSE